MKNYSDTIATKVPEDLRVIDAQVCGIDIGSRAHYVAAPEGGKIVVKEFSSYTPALKELCDWLKRCKVSSVAMESTGVYWIPACDILEEAGIEVLLVDPRKVKNVCGRKSDLLDCQWLQQLHSYGLLRGAFRPAEKIRALRTCVRYREVLVREKSGIVLRMQKSLQQMNVQLHHVLSEITGVTGMKILRAIASGESNIERLLRFRNAGCKKSKKEMGAALKGHYRKENIFVLKSLLAQYDFMELQIKECDVAIQAHLNELADQNGSEGSCEPPKKSAKASKKRWKNDLHFDANELLAAKMGVDLTTLPGLSRLTVLKLLSEVGYDLSQFKSAKHFSSWLGLSPRNDMSGGKILKRRTNRNANRVANYLRLAAQTLYRSHSAIGAFYRRLSARKGAPKAMTATARKLAVIFFNCLTKGQEYVEIGENYYNEQYKKRKIHHLKREAKKLGFELVQTSEPVLSPEATAAPA